MEKPKGRLNFWALPLTFPNFADFGGPEERMTRGAVYWACGNPAYQEWAHYSARSLRKHNPGVKAFLLTDRMPKEGRHFNMVQVVREPVAAGDYHGYKIQATLASPWDTSLLMDCDTVVCGDLTGVFELVEEKFDIAVTHSSGGKRSRFPADGVPDAYPQVSSGFVAFRLSPPVWDFLVDWGQRFDSHKATYAPLRKGHSSFHPDQDTFRIALYHSNLRVIILEQRFNCTFWNGYLARRANVVHVHGAGGRKLAKMAAKLNERPDHPRVFFKRELKYE